MFTYSNIRALTYKGAPARTIRLLLLPHTTKSFTDWLLNTKNNSGPICLFKSTAKQSTSDFSVYTAQTHALVCPFIVVSFLLLSSSENMDTFAVVSRPTRACLPAVYYVVISRSIRHIVHTQQLHMHTSCPGDRCWFDCNNSADLVLEHDKIFTVSRSGVKVQLWASMLPYRKLPLSTAVGVVCRRVITNDGVMIMI